ncbi:uncharacterized protein LOC109857614 [Pseudomyrmex gracilis]|uniref:uncharacterized protein LOC109857614 n=1 Tax=Pseudomyrmex gracilis TaxID=219809 RepID=UPI0009951914|nr:uncharacterized protein LOC109857614 [Pseudomyrmex gracilis]
MIFTRKYKPEAIEPLRLWREDIEYVQKAMGKSWGIKLNTALWIYKAVLVLKLTYAAVVWWPRVEKMESKNLLKNLQGNYLRAAVGTMRTTPTETLEVALCIPPLRLTIISATEYAEYARWTRFSINLTTRANWKNRNLHIQPGTHAWFTDGSGANGCYGAGIYCPGSNHREFFFLGKLATVFQAEVLAILKCARILLSRETKTKRINIYTDSKTAIEALAKTTTESSVVWDCMQALNRLGEQNNITLVWVPGHQGKNHIKDWLKKEHRISWEILKSCRQAKALMTQPLPGRTKELLTMSKYRQRLCIGLLTGHWAFKAYLFNLGLIEKSNCRFCGEERKDSVHILCRCPSLALKRFRSLGSI